MEPKTISVVFTHDNESYLGWPLLFRFDRIIGSAMLQNVVTAPMSHQSVLTDRQNTACQVIAHANSITLSIRELIRQGYLFGGHILLRALVERAAILLYLNFYPNEIDRWNRGWLQNDAPSLATMLDAIQTKQHPGPGLRGRNLTAPMNSLLHSKPDSAPWNMVSLGQTGLGHAAPWLAVVQGMMGGALS